MSPESDCAFFIAIAFRAPYRSGLSLVDGWTGSRKPMAPPNHERNPQNGPNTMAISLNSQVAINGATIQQTPIVSPAQSSQSPAGRHRPLSTRASHAPAPAGLERSSRKRLKRGCDRSEGRGIDMASMGLPERRRFSLELFYSPTSSRAPAQRANHDLSFTADSEDPVHCSRVFAYGMTNLR